MTQKTDPGRDLALLLVKTAVMEQIKLSECQIEDDVFSYGQEHPDSWCPRWFNIYWDGRVLRVRRYVSRKSSYRQWQPQNNETNG